MRKGNLILITFPNVYSKDMTTVAQGIVTASFL